MSIKFIVAGPAGKLIPIDDLGNGNFAIYGTTFCVKFFETHTLPTNKKPFVSIFTINSITGGQYGTIYKISDIDLYFASHYDIVYSAIDPLSAAARLIAEV